MQNNLTNSESWFYTSDYYVQRSGSVQFACTVQPNPLIAQCSESVVSIGTNSSFTKGVCSQNIGHEVEIS
jgi:hypothetical protein